MRRSPLGLPLIPFLVVMLAISLPAHAQQEEQPEKTFKDIRLYEHTSTKNQASTSTCWCFSAISFLESELMRAGKGEWDLSEMFVVHNVYIDKARIYMRMHGFNNFGPGALGHDVFNAILEHGIVRDRDYSGLWEYETAHNHGELHNVLKGYMDGVLRSRPGPSPKWEKGLRGILDAYLGSIPGEIIIERNRVTPKRFTDDILGLNPEDYIEITSFSHMPFYEEVCLLVPDNWVRDDNTWNLPIDDVMKILEYALMNGYTAIYGGDVSEQGFDQKKGYAIWNEDQIETQDERQKMWDFWTTTDDHGMHIVGIAKDEEGKTFYRVKNSWGEKNGPYGGHIYMSENFIRAKFDLITVHKDAIPADIKTRMKSK